MRQDNNQAMVKVSGAAQPENNPPIYDGFDKLSDLNQGDIIKPIESVRQIFSEVHKHFLDPKYNAFLVLTQTCDLVRRKGKCRTNYINLAVVRPLEDVLISLLENTCRKVKVSGYLATGIYEEETKQLAEMLLGRIFNQNEQSFGLFFLSESVDTQIEHPSVALLQVSIALRAKEHYDTLVRARSGRLSPPFQSKLGWLIGNLFSRIATPDWPKTKLKEMIEETLEISNDPKNLPQWITRKNVKEADKKGVNIEGLTRKEILKTLEEHTPIPPLESAATDILQKIKSRLINDSDFRNACK